MNPDNIIVVASDRFSFAIVEIDDAEAIIQVLRDHIPNYSTAMRWRKQYRNMMNKEAAA